MNKKIIFPLVLALAVVLVMGSVSAGLFDFLNEDSNTVKIGYLPSNHESALFVADSQKLYEKRGISTEFVPFDKGKDLMTAMASGEIDVGYCGITPVLSSISNGAPVKIISSVQNEGSGILVTSSSGISDAKDLSGKTVATISDTSVQQVLLAYYLKNNGLSLDDVNEVFMNGTSMNDALKTGEIPAAMTGQHFISIALTEDNISELVDSSEILPGHPCCVVVASQDFLDNHQDTAKDIVEVHKNATNYINNQIKANNTKEIVKLLPKEIVFNEDTAVTSLESFPFTSGLNDTYKSNVDEFQKLEVEVGLLNKTIPQDTLYWAEA